MHVKHQLACRAISAMYCIPLTFLCIKNLFRIARNGLRLLHAPGNGSFAYYPLPCIVRTDLYGLLMRTFILYDISILSKSRFQRNFAVFRLDSLFSTMFLHLPLKLPCS
jgi:hypothetical protein